MEDSLENYIKIYSSTKDGLQNNAKDNATRWVNLYVVLEILSYILLQGKMKS